MALTYTPPGELGARCPDFALPAMDGKTYKLADFSQARALVVVFMCNHCPYVKAIEDRLIALNKELEGQKAQLVGICSNDPEEYPEDSFTNLKARWREKNYGFVYLHDEDQGAAKAFGAVCTPDFFVFDSQRQLAYRGRLDDSWKDSKKVSRRELSEAVTAIVNGRALPSPQLPSMGCSIKWKES